MVVVVVVVEVDVLVVDGRFVVCEFEGIRGVSVHTHVSGGQLSLLHSVVHQISKTSMSFHTLIAWHILVVGTTTGVFVVV